MLLYIFLIMTFNGHIYIHQMNIYPLFTQTKLELGSDFLIFNTLDSNKY